LLVSLKLGAALVFFFFVWLGSKNPMKPRFTNASSASLSKVSKILRSF
jgi:hypothetical protein